ncbi:uncharacterized protein EV420DRAFT_1483633 [Desarmillaria tabescens]|uniref:Uncharacterized protein n=1 Tax=Armillaria tabescens TaxID=1929756 RepID=A0AA39JS58_ARMTA|nr:uncharacterized protein EV420DRAFT_1483633 [Desarmillaria tabescens]KAK0447818.1 hypothetical protein EV420DRAFT_1483633 [Desarmillaria tabescens]
MSRLWDRPGRSLLGPGAVLTQASESLARPLHRRQQLFDAASSRLKLKPVDDGNKGDNRVTGRVEVAYDTAIDFGGAFTARGKRDSTVMDFTDFAQAVISGFANVAVRNPGLISAVSSQIP